MAGAEGGKQWKLIRKKYIERDNNTLAYTKDMQSLNITIITSVGVKCLMIILMFPNVLRSGLCILKKLIKRLHIPSALGGGGVAFATGGPVGSGVGFIVGGGPTGVGPVGGGP